MRGRIKRPEAGTRLALPRVGFIKTGFKDDRGYPRSVNYFIPVGKYAGIFTKAYGDKPQTIQIFFPDDDPTKVCSERYEYRDNDGKLYARGDGEEFEIWDGTKYQKANINEYPKLMETVAKRCPTKATKAGESGWDVVLTLNFIVPMVKGVAGVWQFTTKGEMSTIPQIRDVFDAMFEARGFVKGIIFDLTVDFAKSQKPGAKSRYPVVSLIPNESEENIERLKGTLTKAIGGRQNE